MKALCVKSYSELQGLVAGQVTTVEAKFVEREVADLVENGLQQLVPYVVFYNMDVSAGKLKFIQYLRPGQTVEGTDERISGNTSIGFGHPIAESAVITATETATGENGETSYTVSLQDIITTGIDAGLQTVLAQTGVDVKAVLGDVLDLSQIAFFTSDVPADEHKVRTGIAIPVHLTAEQFELLRTTMAPNAEVIEKLDMLGINVDRIVEEMDITPTINNVVNELVGKYNLEAWSTMMFNYIVRKELHAMMVNISYQDIVALVHAKRAALAQVAQETATQQQAEAETAQAAENVSMDTAVETTTTEQQAV